MWREVLPSGAWYSGWSLFDVIRGEMVGLLVAEGLLLAGGLAVGLLLLEDVGTGELGLFGTASTLGRYSATEGEAGGGGEGQRLCGHGKEGGTVRWLGWM